MLRSALALAAAFTSCAPDPCVTTSYPSAGGCRARDGGDALVAVRAYSALDEVFVDACLGQVSDAGLTLTATVRACPAGTSTGPSFADCVLPQLPPGRHSLGNGMLVVPDDGGFTSCD